MINAVTDKRIRAYVLSLRDADKVRITRNGEVHYRKNALWHFEGFTENIADHIQQLDRDRAYFEDEANRDKVLLGRHH
jgi:hypothetical protein